MVVWSRSVGAPVREYQTPPAISSTLHATMTAMVSRRRRGRGAGGGGAYGVPAGATGTVTVPWCQAPASCSRPVALPPIPGTRGREQVVGEVLGDPLLPAPQGAGAVAGEDEKQLRGE